MYQDEIAEQFAPLNLDEVESLQYMPIILGNDPIIENLESQQYPGKSALVAGNGGLRALSVICRLQDNNTESVPKLVIMDRSTSAIALWSFIKELAESQSQDSFLEELANYKKFRLPICSHLQGIENPPAGSDYLNISVERYFIDLFEHYGYQHIIDIIRNCSLIHQDWQNTRAFEKLKSIFSYLEIDNVYVYASNIVKHNLEEDFQGNPEKGKIILDNIALLSPKLAIHTDYCRFHCMPEKVYLLTVDDDSTFLLAPGAYTGINMVSLLTQIMQSNLISSTEDTELLLAALLSVHQPDAQVIAGLVEGKVAIDHSLEGKLSPSFTK